MSVDLTNPIFHNEDAARAHLECVRWPDGPVCVHCGSKRVTRMEGKSHRPGLFHCNDCEKPFTVTMKSVMERSKIPLAKWVLGFHLMAASKKGVSSHQLHRMLGITYKSAWFLSMRIREAMGLDPETSGPIGGDNLVVESDETYVGGKAANAHKNKPIPKKHAVVTLVQREGQVRAKHVPNVTARNIKEHLAASVDKRSYLVTDESPVYVTPAKDYSGHASVNHSKGQYVRLGGFVHVNTAESFHAIIKRQMYGTHHAVSEWHLQRYIDELAFRWNNRISLGIDDTQRAANAIKGAEGKRLMYKKPRSEVRAG
jgi:transposase-like protein